MPLAIFIFSLISFFIKEKTFENKLNKRILFSIFFALFIFNMKNLNRIHFEFGRNDQFKFNNFPYFFVPEKKFKPIYSGKDVYLNVVEHHCWATPSPCSNTIYKIKNKAGFIFFKR